MAAPAGRLRQAVAVLLLAAAAWCAFATPPDVGTLLERADAMRSVDPRAFEQLVVELDARTGEATPAQREHLRYLKAYQLAYTGRFDLAIQEAATLFETASSDELRFRAGLLAANSYAATREFGTGLGFMDKSLALMPRIRDRQLRHDGFTVAALLYNQVGQYELGRQFAERILADAPGERSRCFAGYLRMEAIRHAGGPGGDAAAIDELLALCAEQGEALATGFVRAQRARLLAEQGKIDEAVASLADHLPAIEATRYPRLVTEIHSLMAWLHLQRGDLDRSDRHSRQAIAGSGGSAYSLPVVEAYRTLYETALRRGDTAGALEHFRAYAAADKAYLDDVKARELAFQLARHETLQKTQTIELLNNQNRVLQLEQKVAQQSARNVQLLVALLVVLLASIGTWAWRTKRTQVTFRRLAETDALTGVSNRHHFSRRSLEALDYCRRTGEEAALVMFDLDRFKAVNDGYGHAVGDWVLVQVARACGGACRKNDLFGRLGGEEFAFLLVGADARAATDLAQLCRQRLHAIDTAETGREFVVSASFGVATSTTAGYDFHTLLARADEAMYRAKRDGRDRVAADGPAAAPTPA
jgi:diguanylate cyclase (GGDEF)-like protein